MNWIVLTIEQAAKYKQYLITPWWGIDPIQIKDGRWVLREDQIKEVEDLTVAKDIELTKFDTEMDIIEELKAIPIKDIVELKEEDFKTEEIEEIIK